ncbi:MAG: hypothetical protein JW748_04890 [Anaerolineales bacterium]|nr:hypothetical protein [Anaerolineales bacterium]
MAKPDKPARRKLRLSEKIKRAQKRHPPAEHLPYSEPWEPAPARSLEAKLFEFSREILSYEEFKREQKNFCGPLEAIRDWDEGEIAGLFLEWFLRDCRLEGGGNVLEEFEGVKGPGLPAPERSLLGQWIDFSQRRVLEVRDKLPGDRTRLRDILTGEEWDVYDRSLAAQAVRWDIHYARLYPMPQAMGLFGTSFLLDPTDAPGMRAFLAALRAAGQGRTAAEFYRDFYPVILKEILRLQNERLHPPVIHTPEGDPFEPGMIRFRMIDRKAALARLNSMPEITPDNPDADGRSVLRYVWLEPEEGSKPATPSEPEGMTRHSFRMTPDGRGAMDSQRILGFLRVSRGVLELECLSRARLERGRALLSKGLRGAAEAEPGIREPRPAERSGGEEKEIPPEVIREIEDKMRRKFSAEWPDQSIPALNGLTPRQAAADPVARIQLEALLKGMETRNARMEAAGKRPVMDAAGIRRELGMDAGDDPDGFSPEGR